MVIKENFIDNLIEVKLKDPNDFLKVKETLTRIGIASRYQNKLYQSCHILSKKNKSKYYIIHFKELFVLDKKETDLTENDIARRNTIANLLASWGLIELVDPEKSKSPTVPLYQIKILPYEEKQNWKLISKCFIGKKRFNK